MFFNSLPIHILYFSLFKMQKAQASTLWKASQGISDITTITIPYNTTIVSFGSNVIERIPGNYFVNLPSLHKIIFNNNQIRIIDNYSFIHLGGLQELLFSFNNLEIISANMLKGLYSLQRLLLNGNEIKIIVDYSFMDLGSL